MPAIKLAVIGYGFMSRQTYCPLLHAFSGRVELAALVEPDEQRRHEALQTYAFDAGLSSVEELLAGGRPDAALVLVPAAFHADVIRPLLDAKVDVYTEKPDTWKLSEAEELVALASAKGRVYQVGQNRLFMTAIQKARSFFADTPVDFIAVEKSKKVLTTDAEYLLDDGIHVLSPLMHLAGDITEVLGAVHVENRLLSAHFRLASGGAGTLTQHVDAGYWVERFQMHGPQKSSNIITPDHVELYQGQEQVGGNSVGRLPMLFDPASLLGFREAVGHFLDCVESRAEPIGSAASLLRVHEVMNEVFAMAGIGKL